jgi:molybdopterin/thiamine biosynthesis adenylyltransferase
MSYYRELTLRNVGYVSDDLQKSIQDCRLLIAGCGIGSTIAEAAVRIGFERFVLVDADRVEPHNLNRQAYCQADIGSLKPHALERRIRSINPDAQVASVAEYLGPANVAAMVAGCDFVFDTIDFLDLNGIVSLHDEANRQGKRLISAMSAGWGAALMYFPPEGGSSSRFRRMIGLPAENATVENASYARHFSQLFETLSARLSPEIVHAMARALGTMEDGAPCPAPHVSPGSYSVAALAVSCAVRLLRGAPVTAAPNLILVDLFAELTGAGIRVLDATA